MRKALLSLGVVYLLSCAPIPIDDPVTGAGGISYGLMTHEGKRKPAFYAYRRAR